MEGSRATSKNARDMCCGPFTKTIHPTANLSTAGSPSDQVHKVEDLNRIGFKMPTVKELYGAIPAHCRKRSLTRSFGSLFRDILFFVASVLITKYTSEWVCGYSKIFDLFFWLTYAFIVGTVLTGLWVVGHECGHGAFSEYGWVNDLVGLIVHTPLLVPFFSWKFSHGKHHAYTNHLTYGETHVPPTLPEAASVDRSCGENEKYPKNKENQKNRCKTTISSDYSVMDIFMSMYQLFSHLVLGWPAYLFVNATGGRRGWDGKPSSAIYSSAHELVKKDTFNSSPYTINPQTLQQQSLNEYWRPTIKGMNHFWGSNSKVFFPYQSFYVSLSGISCLIFLGALAAALGHFGWFAVMRWYVGPYLVTNGYLVAYTWLHHTHPNIPHFGEDSFTWLRGALATIDRPWPSIIDEMHHYIGSTHVLHHFDPKIPHYHAREATEHLKNVLGDFYRVDNTPILESLWVAATTCQYVDDLDSVQFYKNSRDLAALRSNRIPPPKMYTTCASQNKTAQIEQLAPVIQPVKGA